MIPDIHPIQPSKNFVTNTNHYRFYSLKTDRLVDAYSWLERINLLHLEFDPSVSWFCEQPIRIEERVGGRQLVYTPDTLVLRGGQLIYQEVKPDERLVQYGPERLPLRWPRVRQWAELHDHQIEFVTDVDLLSDRLRIRNLLLLAPFLRASQYLTDSSLRRSLFKGLHATRPRRICDWVEEFSTSTPLEVVNAIAVLYQQGRVHLPLSTELLTPNSLVVSHEYH